MKGNLVAKSAIFRGACLALGLLCGSTLALAADYPNRQVTITVPYAAGGTADILARLMADELRARFGQAFIVENKSGAGGMIGAAAVARAANDGYNLLFTAGGPLTIAPNLGKKLVVNSSSPIRSVGDLVAAAKSKPGSFKFGSPGIGTSVHLLAELFRLQANLDVIHIPYRGGVLTMNDLLGGQVDYMFENLPQLLPQVSGGTLRALAVTSAARQPTVPAVPTLTEAGITGVEVGTWYGLLGPRDLPPPVAAGLTRAFTDTLRSERFRNRLTELGGEVDGRTGAEFARFIADDDARWRETISRAKIEPE
ncbi:tripartite tricarboxylate transporter substrate binding protein [Bradyrhizobium sp. Cp5.3]|uniref:Bug family tripartite tricarboxylate transporter substrate binding protein n=1 Tax=Bradyrhizobium sp. Cp5.3 TaxID=443598 RepID=UPI0012EB3719|nr:tripartite tricarboxylate transporter substrate binding protein [Bradyrhizobium sp. Cp5.3]